MWWYTTFREKMKTATDEELPRLYETLYREYLCPIMGHPPHERAIPISLIQNKIRITDIANDYRLVRFLMRQFIGNGKILELGCGPASFPFILVTDGYDVTAVDMRESVIENQRNYIELLPEEFKDKIRFDCSLAENLSYPDDYFDVIVGVDFLEHVRDLDRLLIECNRVLRISGRMFFATPTNGIGWSPEHLHDFTKENLGTLFNNHKFRTRFYMERYYWLNLIPNVLVVEVFR